MRKNVKMFHLGNLDVKLFVGSFREYLVQINQTSQFTLCYTGLKNELHNRLFNHW